MRMIGASVEGRRTPALSDVVQALEQGLPFVFLSNGEDCTGIFAERGESQAEVLRTAHRFIPELAA